MFVENRARLYIHLMVTVFPARVKEPNETSWKKLVRMIKYLNGTNKKYLNLSNDGFKVVLMLCGINFCGSP